VTEAFLAAWSRTGRLEAGYVNHPSDPGGETNHGITVAVARAHGYLGPMVDLPASTALAIAKAAYWDEVAGDRLAALSSAVAFEVFDTHFNLWRGAAGQFLQRSLNALNGRGAYWPDLRVDGAIGDATIGALAAFLERRRRDDGEAVLVRMLNSLQGADYVRQAEANPLKEDFVFGWFRHRVVI
jgi:lysozyme family protein